MPIDLARDIPKARPGYEQLCYKDRSLFGAAAMRRARRLKTAGHTGAHSTSSRPARPQRRPTRGSLGHTSLRDGNGRAKRQVQALNRPAMPSPGAPIRHGRPEARSQGGQALGDIIHRASVGTSAAGSLPECGWWCRLTGTPTVKVGKFEPVTLGHMRSQGCRDLLVYCDSGRCNHSTIMNVGHLPDETPIKSLGDSFVCAKCGHLGADAVPNWPSYAASRPS